MATCFRGAVPFARHLAFQLPPGLRAATLENRTTQPNPFAAARFFSSTSFRTASTKYKPSTTAPTSSTIKAATAKAYQAKAGVPLKPWERDVLHKLASKGAETVLYAAPKQNGFRIVCYTAAFACFGAAASSYKFFFEDFKDEKDRNGLASWVPLAFGVIAVFWACIGTWLAAAPVGVVRSISAVPKLGPQRSLALRIEVMRLPFMKDKVYYVSPPDVTADGSIAATTVEYAVARQGVIDAKKPRPDDPVMLKPFLALGRLVSRSFYTLMIYTKMSVMREGFVKIRINNGIAAKIDCAGELAMGGHVLDQLIKIL
ncbi:hypothetical protein B0J12DRAFT_31163 [Macrophomina phaseolina]|uniref:Uncharacterized protein n=1 Tax=Macrophomina phaseolina TaxID=35725 RepID=A0ABQ8GW49_9PEZI|nr:hypothetical protein B0J12DRAFT_31163 [Macrophomina phaseolina]